MTNVAQTVRGVWINLRMRVGRIANTVQETKCQVYRGRMTVSTED
jgi:hypothetical protein